MAVDPTGCYRSGVPTLSAKERRELPERAFAYIDAQGRRRLPINDEGHVRAALGRFNQVDFEDEEARAEACKRLLLAARKYGIVPIGFVTRQMRSGAGASAPKLPTGPVTLLFADIEASTALLEMLGDEYIRVLEEVRSLLRREVRSRKGVEVDARADEFFAAFARPADAIEGAIAIQRTLRSKLWPRGTKVCVRAGIHTGSPKVVERAYVGLPVVYPRTESVLLPMAVTSFYRRRRQTRSTEQSYDFLCAIWDGFVCAESLARTAFSRWRQMDCSALLRLRARARQPRSETIRTNLALRFPPPHEDPERIAELTAGFLRRKKLLPG